MSYQSITNKLVANIKQTSTSSITTIKNNEVICIDSSNNRIGINTLDPSYSLTISGNSTNNAVSAPYLYITNSGIINELSVNSIVIKDASINDLSLTTGEFKFGIFESISCESISCNILDVSTLNLINNKLNIENIICTDEVSTNMLTVDSSAIINNLTITGNLEQENIDLLFLTCNICGEFQKIICSTISGKSESHIDIKSISCDFLDASFINTNGMYIESNISVSGDIVVDGSGIFRLIETEELFVEGLTLESVLNNNIGNNLAQGIYQNISAANITISNELQLLYNSEIIMHNESQILYGNFLPSYLKIPKITPPEDDNYIKFVNNVLHIGDKSLAFTNDIVHLSCNNNISGQLETDFSFNNTTQRFEVTNYNYISTTNIMPNAPKYNKYNNYHFNFIPLLIDFSSGGSDIFEVNDISCLKISFNSITSSTNKIFDLNAYLSLKFYNKIPNDVEVNSYIFGVNTTDRDIKFLTYTNNNIIVYCFEDLYYNFIEFEGDIKFSIIPKIFKKFFFIWQIFYSSKLFTKNITILVYII